MQQKTIDKLLLCLQEQSYIKEILDKKCADDQLAHILGIYAAIRMDDFIHMLPIYPASNNKEGYISEHTKNYQDRLMDARNKLGAHFQHIVGEEEDGNDYIERNKVFQGIDYKTVVDAIDNAKLVFQIATDTLSTAPAILTMDVEDMDTIAKICSKYNKDHGIRVYNDILGLSRPNGVCIMTCTKGQEKVQHLISLRLFIDDIKALYSASYKSQGLKRMFKRMMICWIINFYDNMITRPLDPSAKQNDNGLDVLLDDYFNKDRTAETRRKVADIFEKMKNIKDAATIIDDARLVRNKCCGHLDGAMDLTTLNATIDSYDEPPLLHLYNKWQLTFQMVLETDRTLAPLNLMPDTVIYDAELESKGAKPFYGDEFQVDNSLYRTSNISINEAIEAIAKGEKDEKYHLAAQKIHDVLFKPEGDDYQKLNKALLDKFSSGMTLDEVCFYSQELHRAKQGYPSVIMDLLLQIWQIVKVYEPIWHLYILWPLSVSACCDKDGRLRQVIDELASSSIGFHQVYGGLILFKAVIRGKHTGLEYLNNPAFDKEIRAYVDAITDKRIKLALCITLASHWVFEYSNVYKKWTDYADKVKEMFNLSFNMYAHEIDLHGQYYTDLRKLTEVYRLVELTWNLAKIEEQLGHNPDVFLDLHRQGLLIGGNDVVERSYLALLKEEIGMVGEASSLLHKLVEEDIYDKRRQINLYCFLNRHDEYKEEDESLKKEIETNFELDERDIEWMGK